MQEQVRRNWLISFILLSLTGLSSIFLYSTIYLKLVFFCVTLLGGVTYYYGFKLRGIGWLSFILCIRGLFIFLYILHIIYILYNREFFLYFQRQSSVFNITPKVFGFYWICGIITSINYWGWSYQLRKMNKIAAKKYF